MPARPRPSRQDNRARTQAMLRVVAAMLITLGLVASSAMFASPAEAAAKSTATSSEYKRIKKGQSLSKVRKIIGGSGKRVSTENATVYV